MDYKNCIECNKPLRGRADKKFCSSLCRNAFHNRKNGYNTRMVRNINQVLKKNRNILIQCNPMGVTHVSRTQLSSRGFNFDYYTNTLKGVEGDKYYFCYDQGYVKEDKDRYKLIDKNDMS